MHRYVCPFESCGAKINVTTSAVEAESHQPQCFIGYCVLHGVKLIREE